MATIGAGIQRWRIGRATVTALVEDETPGVPVGLFYPDLTPADVAAIDWLATIPGAADPAGAITFRVQAFVIELDGRTVLVDPCVGNHKRRALPFWNDLDRPWLDRFHRAGFTTDGVDLVVHTHLHEDHVGWDTHAVDGGWVPTFTGARHLYVGDELDFAALPGRRVADDAYADSIRPVLDAGLGEVVDADADLGGGFRLVASAGHTPGHVCLSVDCGDEQLVVSGDVLHHPFQCTRPDVAEAADADRVEAARIRHELLDQWAASAATLAGTHFPVAPLGNVVADGATWRFVPRRDGDPAQAPADGDRVG